MNVSSVVNHYPTANKGFITTLGSTISAGATTVPLTSVSGLTNGTIFVGLIEPGLANKQEFTGVVDTAGVQITGVKWTDGTNVDHTAGVTIVDYVSATGQNMQTKGHLVSHDQDGTLKAGAVDVTAVIADGVITRPKLATSFGSEFTTGWNTADLPAVSTVTNNGNRSYDITFASTVASILSPGMRLRTTRTVAAPTQCTSLNGTTQYYSKTTPNGMTFTNNFVVSAWVKLSSYANSIVASRHNGTSGWYVNCNASGQIAIVGANAAVGNFKQTTSYQSIPLNKWVHITAKLDMTSTVTTGGTNNYIMIDGVEVPSVQTSGGTAPTALIQAGNLEIGSYNGGTLPFPGKIAQVAIYSAHVTEANIKLTISQGLSGSETSLISAYSFNNSINDLNANANNLTANGSAVATNADSPFGNAGTSSTLDYALVQAVNTTVATVQVPEGCTIPTSGGVTSVAYSVQGNPFGWVSDKGRWYVNAFYAARISGNAALASTWYNFGHQLTIPVGSWNIGYIGNFQVTAAAVTGLAAFATLSTANNSESNIALTSFSPTTAAVVAENDGPVGNNDDVSLSAATPYYMNTKPTANTAVIYFGQGAQAFPTKIFAKPLGL